MDFGDLAAVLAITSPLVWKAVEFMKYLSAREWNAVTTQLVVWFAGTAFVNLLAQTDFAPGIVVGGTTLAALNGASLLFIGIVGGSTASIGYDFKKSVDNKDSAVSPPLLPGSTTRATADSSSDSE